MKMREKILLLALLFILASCYPNIIGTKRETLEEISTTLPSVTVSSNNADEYIGLEYPPLPNKIISSLSSGALIWSVHPSPWSILAVADKDNYMLWFSKILYNDQNGKAHFQVSDVVTISPTAKDQKIVVSECLFDGVIDYEIVALVKVDEESLQKRRLYDKDIVLAWRANQAKGILESISTSEIECNAETFLGFP